MSFRRQRHLVALSGACLALLLQGCASLQSLNERETSPASQTGKTPGGEIWQVINGGLQDVRAVAGPIDYRFMQPVAVAARGHLVYIVDVGLQKLFVYDSQTDRMRILKDLRGILHGVTAAIYLNRDFSFYLADGEGARVLHFDPDGKLINILESRPNLGRPVGVVVNDATGYVFIADGFYDHILVYTPDGRLDAAIGGRGGPAPGRFRGVTSLAESPHGFYVGTRFGTDRVQVMGNDGLYLESFQEDTVTFPTAIAVRGDGLAFVSDYLSDDIKVFEGTRLAGTIGGHGSAPGRFRRIMGLWLDEGFLYVADSLNRRIQVLTIASLKLSKPPPVSAPASTPAP
jgi:DNA-binding beta-propeller fold protein YncE